MENLILEVSENLSGERLDKFISIEAEDISRSYAQALIKEKKVYVNNKEADKNYRVRINDVIEIEIPEPDILELKPENIPLDIVYEDEDLLVINKKQGMVVHPAPGNLTGTLVNALMYHCGDSLSAINGVVRPGIVHRIDKETSGLLVIAKNNNAHIHLSEQIKKQKALRKYLALVNGKIKEEGIINAPIGRSTKDRKKMAIAANGRDAETKYIPIEHYNGYTLCECILKTGRTHQIRVHLASIGHSVVGDKVYGIKKEKFNLNGQLLHAKALGFIHPTTGEQMQFEANIPDYFENVLNKLRKETF